MNALKGAGIAERDIRTSRLSIFPQMTSGGNNTAPRITGYRATNARDRAPRATSPRSPMSSMPRSAQAPTRSAASTSSSQSRRSCSIRRAARRIADARRKAEIYAQAAGVVLGNPLAISEDTANPPTPMYRMDRAAAHRCQRLSRRASRRCA